MSQIKAYSLNKNDYQKTNPINDYQKTIYIVRERQKHKHLTCEHISKKTKSLWSLKETFMATA